MRTTSAQKKVIRDAKVATQRFREAFIQLQGFVSQIHEISQEEFIARRNRVGSSKYKFRHTRQPLTKLEIQNLFDK